MLLESYLPILIQFTIALSVAIGILLASHAFGQRARKNKIKDTAYECGLLPQGKTPSRFCIKFYAVAMLFIIFDVEIVFLIPWTLVYREFLSAAFPILTPVLFFLTVLAIGLLYEFKKGALKWDK
jgi:NADH-quinone oxidoreductase subunit A